jgi:hypothetical protein
MKRLDKAGWRGVCALYSWVLLIQALTCSPRLYSATAANTIAALLTMQPDSSIAGPGDRNGNASARARTSAGYSGKNANICG